MSESFELTHRINVDHATILVKSFVKRSGRYTTHLTCVSPNFFIAKIDYPEGKGLHDVIAQHQLIASALDIAYHNGVFVSLGKQVMGVIGQFLNIEKEV